jgi:pimeloyl-ACP methyl ester carboxylesterase
MSALKLSYQKWGQGTEPLLLLHGLADNALVWASLAEYLAPNFQIVAPDLRGHGNSDKPKTGYTFPELIADLRLLFEHLGWSSAHILAHSWSAKIATLWATSSPENFRSLILVDPFFIEKIPIYFKFTFPLLYRVLPFLKTMGPFPSYDAAERQARQLKQYRGWSDLQLLAWEAGIEQKTDGIWGSKFTVNARNEIFLEIMKVAGLAEVIDLPTLFIKPKKGLNRTEWQLKPYRKYLTNLTITEVPGNHWAFLVEPDTFNLTVANFLTRIRSDKK